LTYFEQNIMPYNTNVRTCGTVANRWANVFSQQLHLKDSVDNSLESGLCIERSADTAKTWINTKGGATNFNNQNHAQSAGLSYKWFADESQKMELNASGNLTLYGGLLYFNGGSNSFIYNDSSVLRLAGDAGVKIQTYSGGWQDRIVVADNGKVTFAADNSADIYAIAVKRSGTSLSYVDIWDQHSTGVVIGHNSSTKMLRVTATGIGVNCVPTYKLEVNGDTKIGGNFRVEDYIWVKGGLKDDGGDYGTNGQVLSTNGNGEVHWVDQSGGSSYSLPTASTSTKGGVKIDGSDFTVNSSTAVMTLHSSVTKRYASYVQMDVNSSNHQFTLNHGLGTYDIVVQVRTASSGSRSRAERFSGVSGLLEGRPHGRHLDIGHDVEIVSCDSSGTMSTNHVSFDFTTYMNTVGGGYDDEYLYVTVIG